MHKYKGNDNTPELSQRLFELNEHSNSTKALMSALGDYWTKYFADYEHLASVTTGCVVAMGTEYRRLLSMVLKSNILDIPFRDITQVDLLCFDEADAEQIVNERTGEVESLVIRNTSLIDADFLTTTLFEAPVVLERGKDFDIDQHTGDITFSVDIFNDEAITQYSYKTGGFTFRKVLFWATNIVLSSTYIYDRYGRFIYEKSNDSEQYKWFITALMYFYTNTKSVKNIENVLNILYGVPFSQKDGEVVQEIYIVDGYLNRVEYKDDESYYCIATDYQNYYCYGYADILVKPGDKLHLFQLMASFHKVDDYITSPNWYRDSLVPRKLFAGDSDSISEEMRMSLIDNVLKYNMIYIELGVSYQTWETYKAQLNSIYNIIKSGIPVYLYPCIGTVFHASFEDKVDSDDEMGNMSAWLSMETRYESDTIYNGGWYYNSHPEFDHGSKASNVQQVTYNGTVRYCGPAKDVRAVHRPYVEDAYLCDGTLTYDGNRQAYHNNEREILSISKFTLTAVDEFSYSEFDGSLLRPLYYTGEVKHNTDSVYGLNNERIFETTAIARLSFEDTVHPPTDDFVIKSTYFKNVEQLLPAVDDDNFVFTYNGSAFYGSSLATPAVHATGQDNLVVTRFEMSETNTYPYRSVDVPIEIAPSYDGVYGHGEYGAYSGENIPARMYDTVNEQVYEVRGKVRIPGFEDSFGDVSDEHLITQQIRANI